jgi:hypothetical protein
LQRRGAGNLHLGTKTQKLVVLDRFDAPEIESFARKEVLRRAAPAAQPRTAPCIAGLWVGLVTPIPNSLAVPLIEGIVEPVLADTLRARTLMPQIVPMQYRDAVSRHVDGERRGQSSCPCLFLARKLSD